MFTSFSLNSVTITLFAWKGKWYFDFNNFCHAVGLKEQRDALQDSLQDYEKSLRETPRQKTWHLCKDFNAIKEEMNKSNKCKLEHGVVVNEHVETFMALIQDKETFLAVGFVFFCEYMQTMYQKWDAKKTSMTLVEFRNHLTKRCPFWLHILDNMKMLQPWIDQYNNEPNPPQNDAIQETDDLLHYLDLYRVTHNQKEEEEEKECRVTVYEPKPAEVTTTTKKKRKRTLSSRDRNVIAADQNWECFYCLSLLDECFEVDHIERFCESGNDHHSNLWALCSSCHKQKDEWDRKRRKTNVWSDYRKLTDQEKKQRRQEILQKIQAL